MKTVLIYRLGSLGDTIVCLPCLHRVAQRFTDSQRIVITNKPVSSSAPRLVDVLSGSDLIHGTVDYPLGSRSPLELGRLWLRLKQLRAETLIYLTAPRGKDVAYRDIKFFRSCGIKTIIGAPVTDDLQANRLDPVTGDEEQECVRLTRTIAELGPIDLDDRSYWDLRLTNDERKVADSVLQPLHGRRFIAIGMGGKSAQNDWGESNWQHLISDLHRRYSEFCFVFVGAESDAHRAANVVSSWPEQMLNLCGKLKLREAAAVLSQASLYIGHDSGPLHLAATCNVLCIGIYSNQQKPRKWHPYGAQHRIIHPSGPISSVPVKLVRDTIVGALDRESSPCRQH
jgi:heptosyltransferase III